MSNASKETPEPSLTLPHFKQSERYTCLPACARMVLAFYGDERDEAELERLFSTTSSGSHEEDVERLREWGYRITCEEAYSLDELSAWVEEGVPVIAFVNAAYWHPQLSDNIPHAVVVVGVTRTRVYLHDPLYSHGPSPVDGADFRAAWLDMDLLYAVIEPPLQQGHYDVQPKGPNHV